MKDRDSKRFAEGLFDGYVVAGTMPRNTAKAIAGSTLEDRNQVLGDIDKVKQVREGEGLVLSESQIGKLGWINEALTRPALNADAFAGNVCRTQRSTKPAKSASARWETPGKRFR